MTPPPALSRRDALLAALASAVAAALCADQISLALRARHAPLAHLQSVPILGFWIPAAAAVAGVAGLALHGVLRGSRLARLPLIACVVLLFAKALVLPDARSSTPALDPILPVQAFAALIERDAPEDRLPATMEALATIVAGLPGPALLVEGQPIEHWQVALHTGCTGPDTGLAGVPPATFLYCLRADGKHAWITAVGLASATFGPPELLSQHGQPVVVEVSREGAPAPEGP